MTKERIEEIKKELTGDFLLNVTNLQQEIRDAIVGNEELNGCVKNEAEKQKTGNMTTLTIFEVVDILYDFYNNGDLYKAFKDKKVKAKETAEKAKKDKPVAVAEVKAKEEVKDIFGL